MKPRMTPCQTLLDKRFFQINHMLRKLSVALSGLPEYLPRLRRPDEIEHLKNEWLSAGQFYPIEKTSGFEGSRRRLARLEARSRT